MLIFSLLLRVVFCCAFRHCIVLSSLNIVTSDSASQISISSDQRSIGDASDIATLQEECIAFGKYTYVLSCHIHFIKITFENIRRMQILFLLVVYVFIITFTKFLRKHLFIYFIFLSFSLSLFTHTHTCTHYQHLYINIIYVCICLFVQNIDVIWFLID